MSLSAATLMRLAALSLQPEQMSEVLRIIADMQAVEDERKAKQRDRTAKHRGKNVTVTLPEHDGNGDGDEQKGTALAPKETPPTPPKEITPNPTTKTEIPKQASAKRPCRFPPDLALDDKISSEAKRLGLTPDEIPLEFEKFRDHHVSKGNVMADWLAAWRTWCRNAVQFSARQARAPPSLFNNGSKQETTADVRARFAAKHGLDSNGDPISH